MSRNIYYATIILAFGVLLILFGVYILDAVIVLSEAKPAGLVFIFIVTIPPGLYCIYVSIRSFRKIQRGIDPWFSDRS